MGSGDVVLVGLAPGGGLELLRVGGFRAVFRGRGPAGRLRIGWVSTSDSSRRLSFSAAWAAASPYCPLSVSSSGSGSGWTSTSPAFGLIRSPQRAGRGGGAG